ncbi:hypothetical protein [Methylobacterium haplocladii]|uniref:Uncharacterized protein n=1 Tax=Methylobacterium haplocladii TaxID=1176176 RepID=A0A512IRX6_9HYPH|nr:hypothetical protein MHA02_28450 [Methylobacterium haplocladii]GJD82521.1 hypothetical protein HPGCJGGD_0378 [Methylobacterium haplocladii]GLS59605.1 hypothetical protein GCM10007887_22740 [Methylobacterium haplocladii]
MHPTLEDASKPEGGSGIGSLLTSIAREAGGLTDAEAEQFDRLRDKTPAEPMRFKRSPDAAAAPEAPIHRRLTP